MIRADTGGGIVWETSLRRLDFQDFEASSFVATPNSNVRLGFGAPPKVLSSRRPSQSSRIEHQFARGHERTSGSRCADYFVVRGCSPAR